LGAVYAVVLAAGRGERFGGDKLLAPWRGRPLLWHALARIRHAMDQGLLVRGCVVIRPHARLLEELVREAGLMPVVNPTPSSGLGSSIRAGLEWATQHAGAGSAAAAIVLGDQPVVPPEVLAALIGAWNSRKGLVLRPRYAGAPDEPGHPTVIDRSLWPLANELTGEAGLGPLLVAHGISILSLDVPGCNPDVDTPTDLMKLEGTEP
jgi:molybdenum cofactor cytidylyltransferase